MSFLPKSLNVLCCFFDTLEITLENIVDMAVAAGEPMVAVDLLCFILGGLGEWAVLVGELLPSELLRFGCSSPFASFVVPSSPAHDAKKALVASSSFPLSAFPHFSSILSYVTFTSLYISKTLFAAARELASESFKERCFCLWSCLPSSTMMGTRATRSKKRMNESGMVVAVGGD